MSFALSYIQENMQNLIFQSGTSLTQINKGYIKQNKIEGILEREWAMPTTPMMVSHKWASAMAESKPSSKCY